MAPPSYSGVDMVNLLAGSFTKGDQFSTGNTMPLVGRPWGFNHFSIQTNGGESSWWFSGSEHEFRWLRCTHQPSPWIGDYAYFVFGPQMGHFTASPVGFFEPRGAWLKPHGLELRTAPDGMRIGLAPSMRGAILRVDFPAEQNIEKRICFGHAEEYLLDRFVARKNSGAAPGLALWVKLEHSGEFEARGKVFCLAYPNDAGRVEVRLSTSFISFEQAEENKKELSTTTYELLLEESRREWEELLMRVEIVDPPIEAAAKDMVVLYTGLYRALTFPRRIDEGGRHWSPYDGSGKIYDGILVTDNGFWDTFRTVYPLLSLVYPDHLEWIIGGWIAAYREGGWIPKWASPGYRNSMVGTYGDVVVADALIKGFVADPRDRADAIAALRKDAEVQGPPGGAKGRVGLSHYARYHYIPSDVGVSDCVSRTLDFAFADYAIANAANLPELRDRARDAMRHLFDPETRLFRPKTKAGSFQKDFRAARWGDGYTEGSPWHHSFPPFDMNLLLELHGSPESLLSKLGELVKSPSVFEPGSYGRTIHEMREMRALAMGQYGHNNQPSHHALYLFALAGDPNTTHSLVRTTMSRAYGTDFYSGDEDNGEMGAWFVLSAIGLYAVAPGASEDYVLTTPLFDKIRIRNSVSDLFIETIRPSRSTTDVSRIIFNNSVLHSSTIRFSALKRGGHLRFYHDHPPPPAAAAPMTTTTRLRPLPRVVADAPPSSSSSSSSGAEVGAQNPLFYAAALLVGLLLGRLFGTATALKRRHHRSKKPNSRVV
ncbi:hypothetical protein CTAYLR_000580 [Chrysophaeum taylorii]|uniref:Alpha-1,2-mannosidase n=1 Tax=Chrysophaeum taylorii TaxID=2483200 RepID=A0AAD7UJ01_9STRA|nr:hypothetical protein CTAYLR_000580 [Chrysophaeum taylorii]